MPTIRPTDTRRMHRRYDRALAVGLILSVAIHVAVLLGWRRSLTVPHSPFSAAGPRAGDDRAAPGGGMRAVRLSYLPPRQPTRPARPRPVPAPHSPARPAPEPQPHVRIDAAQLNLNAPVGTLGQGDVTGKGPGLATGTGRGAGGTEATGAFNGVPPSPRGLILPPADRPGNVRGKQVAVWVFVNAAGRVIPDSTRLIPGTGDHGFDKRLRQEAAEWIFEPAQRDGHAVADWFRYVIVL